MRLRLSGEGTGFDRVSSVLVRCLSDSNDPLLAGGRPEGHDALIRLQLIRQRQMLSYTERIDLRAREYSGLDYPVNEDMSFGG
jgi:hypothetical protein